MNYYLVDTIGTGTRQDPWRARGSDTYNGGAIKLLRQGQTRADMLWLVRTSSLIVHANADLLGVDREETTTTLTRRRMESRLGYSMNTLQETTLKRLIFELLASPPTNGWNAIKSVRLRPNQNREYQVWLANEKIHSVPDIRGGVSASDDFNRANENPIAGNWVSGDGSWGDLKLQSNSVTNVSAATDSSARWNGSTFGNDHYSEVGIVTWSGSVDGPGVAVRMASGTDESSYFGVISILHGDFRIWETNSSFGFTLLANGGTPGTSPVKLKLDVSGSSLDLLEDDVSVQTATDTTITSGQPGLEMYIPAGTSATLDNWAADDGAGGGGRTTRNRNTYFPGMMHGQHLRTALRVSGQRHENWPLHAPRAVRSRGDNARARGG